MIRRFNKMRKEEIHIPVPFKKGRVTDSDSLNKPTYRLYEVLPSLSHENKGIKTFVDGLSTVFDQNKIFTSNKEVVGIEIHADYERISYYFIVPSEYGEFILPKIRKTFKGSSVTDASGDMLNSLHSLYADNSKETNHRNRYYPLTLNLKEPAFLPINMHEKGQMFEELMNTLEYLREGEKAVVQILFQPLHDDWQEQLRESYQSWLEGEKVFKGLGVREMTQMVVLGFSDALQNMTRRIAREEAPAKEGNYSIKEVNQKLTQPGFKTSIRCLIISDESRHHQISRGIVASFRTLSFHNDFVSKSPVNTDRFIKAMAERKISKLLNNHQVLCSSEVANLMKMPDEKVDTPKLQRMTPEERRVDEEITRRGYHIGNTINKPSKPIHFSTKSDDDTARTKLFIASPGGGKSTLIEQIVYEAARHGHGCAVFDVADGRLYERIISTNPEFKHKVICVDYTDEDHTPAFNFSALGGDDATRGLMFAEFFEQLFDTGDLARTQSYMMKAAMAVFVDPRSTLLEFIEMLRSPEFRQKMLPILKKKKPDLYLWWVKEFPKITERRFNEVISPILVRLDHLLYNTRMRDILCQKGGKLDPAKWMDNGNIVVFNMSNGSFTEPEQRVLMSLHNSAFWNATLAREKQTRTNVNPRPFHLIYDEPQTYMGATPMFSRAISKARKYRVSCNFFIQEAEQIIKETPDLWKEILGMSPHIMIGPVSEFTAKHVAKELGMTVEEILSIKKQEYCWILKTYANKKAMNPVVVRTMDSRDKRVKLDMSHAETVKEKWRKYFNSLPKEELNADITARQLGITIEEYYKTLQDLEEEEGDTSFEWGDSDEGSA